jgi:hypothetical protein
MNNEPINTPCIDSNAAEKMGALGFFILEPKSCRAQPFVMRHTYATTGSKKVEK